MARSYFVIGGAGSIGSHVVVELLVPGHRATVSDSAGDPPVLVAVPDRKRPDPSP